MNEEKQEMVVPGLGDIIREWLRGDPLLDKHFFVHKKADMTAIHMKCDDMRTIAGFQYIDYPEIRVHKNRWFIGSQMLDLNPAEPEFFQTIQKYLIQEHNRFLKVNWGTPCQIIL